MCILIQIYCSNILSGLPQKFDFFDIKANVRRRVAFHPLRTQGVEKRREHIVL